MNFIIFRRRMQYCILIINRYYPNRTVSPFGPNEFHRKVDKKSGV